MRSRANFSLLAASSLIALFATAAEATTTIDITYTGTATGFWEGNYSPFGPTENGSGQSGSIGPTNFTISSDFTIPNNADLPPPSGFMESAYFIGATATFTSSVYSTTITNGIGVLGGTNSDASSAGSTSQSINVEPTTAHIPNASISLSTFAPNIPGSIFSNFEIDSDLSGSGTAVFGYTDVNFGGGELGFDLTPETISVSVMTTAVPEPSTWAMLLIGFAGIGLIGNRLAKHSQRQEALS
jgi:PEP-CTERM motif